MEKDVRALTGLLLAAALLGVSSDARAATKQVAKAGVWTAFAGTGDDGKPMCRLTSGGGIRTVHVKYGYGGLFIHVFKPNWRIHLGTVMPLSIRFDEEEPFEATAKRHTTNERLIELQIHESADARRFIDQFATSDKMHITFSGNEREWTLHLDGSDTVAQKFMECVAAVRKKMGPATQPFETKAPKHKQRPPTEEL